jgi:hypothetical protein
MPRRLRVTGTLQQDEHPIVGPSGCELRSDESSMKSYSWPALVCRELMNEGLAPNLQKGNYILDSLDGLG